MLKSFVEIAMIIFIEKILHEKIRKLENMKAENKKMIFIIDDDPDLLNLTAKFLKLGDFDILTCNNANESLRVIEESYINIDMILLNPTIPELNMEEFLQTVKSDERYKHILVFLFIDKLDEKFQKYKSLGANGYIKKPFPKKDENGSGDFPFPHIRKPPSPPGGLGLTAQPQAKESVIKQDLEDEPFCKYCGAELPKGQTICHACGKKVG